MAIRDSEKTTASASPQGAGGRSRLANIERLRVLAILDIIGFHVDPDGRSSMLLGGAGLAIFLLLAHLFNTAVAQRMGAGPFGRLKVRRLMVPWLFWCAVYLGVLLLDSVRAGEVWYSRLDPWMLTYGTAIHLWFVPFACLSGVLVGFAQHRLRPGILFPALSGAALLVGCSMLVRSGVLGEPAQQYVYALPSPFIGFALGRLYLLGDGAARRSLMLKLGGAALLLSSIALGAGWPSTVVIWTAALLVLLVLMRWGGPPGRLLNYLSPLLFGVYLVHPLVIRLGYLSAWLVSHPWLHTGASFLLAAICVRVLKATPLSRFI